jgi:hypothetical protein
VWKGKGGEVCRRSGGIGFLKENGVAMGKVRTREEEEAGEVS